MLNTDTGTSSTESTQETHSGHTKDKKSSNIEEISGLSPNSEVNVNTDHNYDLLPSGQYVVEKNKPETYLNNGDIEKVTDSEIFPQRRLFSWMHSKKMPEVPQTDDERKVFPMHHANIISRIFIWWVYPVIRVGYKRTIQPNDLFKMDDRLSVERLHEAFERNFDFYYQRAKNAYILENPDSSEEDVAKNLRLPRFTLVRALFFTFKYQYLLAVVFAILANCTSGFNPMITKRLIRFVEEKAFFPDKKVNTGIGYAFGACIMILSNGLFFNHFFQLSQLTGVEVQSTLTKAILQKMFKANAYTRHKYPTGKVTSFITTDLARIQFALSFQPFLAGFPAIIAICIVLLIVNLGAISLVGMGIFFACVVVSLIAFKQILKYRLAANIFTDARVTLMREVLNSMRMIKFYAWEDAYEKNIKDVRKKEISKVRQMQFARNFLFALAISLPNIASLVTFLSLSSIDPNATSNPSNVFASLSLYQVLSLQMFFLPIALGTGVDMILGLDRIQGLLEAPEEHHTKYLQSSREDITPLPGNDGVVLKVSNASFEWEDFEVQDQIEADKVKVTKKRKFNGLSFSKRKPKGGNGMVDKVEPDDDKNNDDDAHEKKKKIFTNFTNLNFEIKQGEFIMITGPIGTGKTSLLNALAGFMKKTAGQIEMHGDILLCGYPWILNASVKDNILFGSPFIKEKYDCVLDVCSLNDDMKLLPAGDNTEIGERGITLSGGQKARINLARAVYKNKDIYLFDDVLSAVDARVGKSIMDECLMGYLHGKTRILATHQLSLIESASRIIVLSNDGEVDIGTLEELKERNNTLQNLMQYSSQQKDNDDEEDVDMKPEEVILEKQMTKERSKTDGHTMSKEERAVNSIKIGVYKEYLKAGLGAKGFFFIPLYLTLVIATTFCNLFSSVWLSYWTERRFHRSQHFYMGLYSFFVFASYLFMNGQFTILCALGVAASKVLNLKAVHRLLHTPMSFLDTTPMGRILNRFTKDTDSLDNELTENLRLFVTQFANIIGVCVLCIVYLPWFAIAIPFLFLIFVIVADHYQSAGREIKRLEALQRSHVYNNVNEVLSGMDTIKAYDSEIRFLTKADYLINKMNEAGYLVVSVQRWVAIFLDVVAVMFALIITLLCVTRQFHISASATGVLLTYVLQLPGLLNTILRALTQAENDMNSAERLVTYATELPQEADYKRSEFTPRETWPEKGEIVFENVHFAYRPGLPNVLHGLNMRIKSGEKIGICGRTGAGKSTIMSALFRINELSSGKILIDDVDVSNLGLYDLRRNLAIIPQDPVLFKGTIRKNLDPFNQHSDHSLWTALVRSGAIEENLLKSTMMEKPELSGSYTKMHKFHLYQLVEEEGSNFSLGERQVLALTRALVRDSKVLILDEATSSVDYETDGKIQRKIVEEFGNCTILCIAHRLKTILSYDRILVLDKGNIAEFDTPWNLYLNKDSIFRSMCSRASINEDDFQRNI